MAVDEIILSFLKKRLDIGIIIYYIPSINNNKEQSMVIHKSICIDSILYKETKNQCKIENRSFSNFISTVISNYLESVKSQSENSSTNVQEN